MNYNSLILNNMNAMNGGVYPNGYIPPNPMGNTMNYGGMGYNQYQQPYPQQQQYQYPQNPYMQNMGGYYGQTTQGYYNPYLVQKQQQLQQAQQREEQRKQADIMKKISRSINKSLGREVDDEYLSRYDYKEPQQNNPYQQRDPFEFDHNTLLNMYYGPDGNMMNTMFNQNLARVYEMEQQGMPEDISLANYHKYLGPKLDEIKEQEIQNARKNLGQLYNNQHYRQLIDSRSAGNSYFKSVFGSTGSPKNINIDDMSVTCPITNTVSTEYGVRKQQFFNSILSNR
ncbi:MAG: hypothetical protein ACRCXT_13125 [Paraclostridium sp.]